MNIIVHGSTGHMGRIVCDLAENGFAGAEGVIKVGRSAANDPSSNTYSSLDAYSGQADVVIDFSNHTSVSELLAYSVERSLPVVIATTGHTPEEKAEITAAAEKIPVFYAANMSVGVAVLADLAKRAAAMFPNADIEILEMHHNRKLDAPSGTALMLAESIRSVRPDAEFVLGRSGSGKRKQNEIGISALRMGNEVGTHEIFISTGSETITLKHEAENRSLFAEGALTAAAFVCRQQPGLYNMQDILA